MPAPETPPSPPAAPPATAPEQAPDQRPEPSEDHRLLREAVRAGGELALARFHEGIDHWHKGDKTPVTQADLDVDALLKERLRAARPDYGWLSEESEDDTARLATERQWIVDPIDGTRAFVKGRPHFSVVGALVEQGRPVAAAIYNPATEEFFEAEAGRGAFLNGRPIHASTRADIEGCRMLGAVDMFRHPAWPRKWPAMEVEQRNSIAYRAALVAAGIFDAMLAMSHKHDWDLAAADLIVHEAGGQLGDHRGRQLVYNRPEPRHRSVLAAGAPLFDAIVARIGDIELDD